MAKGDACSAIYRDGVSRQEYRRSALREWIMTGCLRHFPLFSIIHFRFTRMGRRAAARPYRALALPKLAVVSFG
jgi:hypothetical protein